MANQSIKNAFERMWQHVILKLSDYYTAAQVDAQLADIDVSTQIQESLNGLKFVVLSQAEYDALAEKDPSTVYYIYEEV